MSTTVLTSQERKLGITSTWSVFILLVMYAVTTTLGLLSLVSPQDPIGDPYFTIMEILILLIAPLLVINMALVHRYAPPELNIYSLIALIFMIIMATITSIVHFTILTVSRELASTGFSWVHLFLSFRWPSVAYTLDILAWDFFFAISMLFAALVFRRGRLEVLIRWLMVSSGVLSLIGLLGIPLANMQFRNIGIIGYSVLTLFIFPLIGLVFTRNGQVSRVTEKNLLGRDSTPG